MEYWSDGGMLVPNTPSLHYSTTPFPHYSIPLRCPTGIPATENGTGVAYMGAANGFNAADEPERHNESIPGPHEPPSPHRWRRNPERLPRARAIPTRRQAGFRAGKSSIRR